MSSRCSAIIAFSVACASIAGAQERIADQELSATGFSQDFADLDLGALIEGGVTSRLASGRQERIDEAPGIVTVLTREEIRNLGLRTLEEVLQTLPGVFIQHDPLGRVRITIRAAPTSETGTSSENVLLLFNGHPLNEPLGSGATSVNLDIPADDIEQLELLRGPGSVLFGDGALGGVISVTTRLGDLDGIEASVGLGSFGTQRHYVRVGSVIGDFAISGFVYFYDTDGARLEIPRDRQSSIDDLLGPAGVPPVSLAPGLAPTDRREVETSYRVAFREYALNFRFRREVGGNYVGFNQTLGERGTLDNKQWFVDLSWKRKTGQGDLAFRLAYEQDERFEVHTATPPKFTLPGETAIVFPDGIVYQSDQGVRRFGGQAVLDTTFGLEHAFLAGASLQREQTFALDAQANFDFVKLEPLAEFRPLDNVFTESGRSILGAWAQDTWTRNSVSVTGGARLSHYGQGGTLLSPRLAVVWQPAEVTLKFLYGRSFRAPTLSELNFNVPGFLGNTALEPVRMDTIEAFAVYQLGDLRLNGGLFLGFVRDSIRPASPLASPFAPATLVNGPGYDTRGLEIEGLYPFGVENSIFGNYTFQRADDVESGGPAAGIPAHLLNLGATVSAGSHFLITPTLVVRGTTPRLEADPRREVPAYALFNVSFRLQKLHQNLEFVATLQNLFDKAYFDPSPVSGVPGDYPRPGRSILIHATYTF